MTIGADFNSLAELGAGAIRDGFGTYHTGFETITRRATARFERRDWHGTQSDAVERLELYKLVVDQVVTHVQAVLGEDARDKAVWAQMKQVYSHLIAGRGDVELAETFFNSITRRIFATVGVDPNVEYVDLDFNSVSTRPEPPVYQVYPCEATIDALIRSILTSIPFGAAYADLERDSRLAAKEVESYLRSIEHTAPIEVAEVIEPVFYRSKGAFIVGRLRSGGAIFPLVIALRHVDAGIVVDAVLLAEDEVSIVFSYTRSYFHVEAENPHEVIAFLKSILPLKRVAELYISIGYNKHGKTELYRDLLRHLENSDDKFEIARGDKGMVMTVFDLPSYDVVFKIIKDRFAYPKLTTRQEVMDKYQLVFKHDRAGRLVDAQEFEHLQFDRARFSDELLTELLKVAAGSVSVEAGKVHIKHLYTERRMTPLNLYLREADDGAAREAVLDYGQAVKDLAATNIFPGDMLLKNFGVTRHGRVVFYDYDELCLLTDCNFRELPQARHPDEELGSEPWYYVGEDDIFPEEFIRFLGLLPHQRQLFIKAHGDLLGVRFWTQMQARHRAGEVIDIYPYRQSRRLQPGSRRDGGTW